MHPAPSVILFTVLSGMGFGYLACLGLGLWPVAGAMAWGAWTLGYALAVVGLLASTFHLGRPQNAIYALSQWRSSWLSREGIAAIAALLALAPQALADLFGFGGDLGGGVRVFGSLGAALAVATVASTAMIYTQLRTIPRWNHWLTPVMFLTASATGGLLLAEGGRLALGASVLLGAVVLAQFWVGDGLFHARARTTGGAIGLAHLGTAEVFEQPHTSPNYLMREMIYQVGRKRRANLRRLSLIGVTLIPVLALWLLPPMLGQMVAVAAHLIGLLAARWLFFAEAEHVVGLYYGLR